MLLRAQIKLIVMMLNTIGPVLSTDGYASGGIISRNRRAAQLPSLWPFIGRSHDFGEAESGA
jgi:hypothetical protein